MNNIALWLAAHHSLVVEAGTIALGILSALIKILLNVRSVNDWVALAETNPRVLAFARLLSAVGINPISVIQALIDLINGKASRGTVAWARAFQTSASKPLLDPDSLHPSRRPPPIPSSVDVPPVPPERPL